MLGKAVWWQEIEIKIHVYVYLAQTSKQQKDWRVCDVVIVKLRSGVLKNAALDCSDENATVFRVKWGNLFLACRAILCKEVHLVVQRALSQIESIGCWNKLACCTILWLLSQLCFVSTRFVPTTISFRQLSQKTLEIHGSVVCFSYVVHVKHVSGAKKNPSSHCKPTLWLQSEVCLMDAKLYLTILIFLCCLFPISVSSDDFRRGYCCQ